jgi:hypothetical protein
MKVQIVVVTAALALFTSQSHAGTIPYGNIGSVAPTNSFTATATGSIEGYFFGFSAADTDEVRMLDVTKGTASAWTFDNQTTTPGSSYNFGAVNDGDVLEFELWNVSAGYILSSNPSDSVDGINHAYSTWYSGSGGPSGIPAGTFIGMEDLKQSVSDLDYNDDQLVFTDVSSAPTPEPESLFLLGTGLLSLASIGRRKLRV